MSDNGKRIKAQLIINVLQDDKLEVSAPSDFLYSTNLLNMAQRVLLDSFIEQMRHDEQRRIIKPTLKGVLPFRAH